MCGIAGFIDFKKISGKDVLQKMVSSLNHRGPDDSGIELFESEEASVGFGQARLSIIDLSSGGHQPMLYKHYTIVYNGEIYNYAEIKQELIQTGHAFVSGSDTEVILHAFEAWGLEAVHKFIGMFVFVIYDAAAKKIYITRDRAGVKPLFYSMDQGLFLFGSELKALMAHPAFDKSINPEVLAGYFHHGYIAAPYTIFSKAKKLEPGHHLTLDLLTTDLKISRYWSASDFYRMPKLNIDYETARDEMHELLKSATAYRMVADVPVGVFLSGGYDSTAVTAILQKQQSSQLKTFTIGFEMGNNEAPFAKETAKYLGTDHTEYYCSTKECQDIIPQIPFFFDEPFADSSAIPTMLVSKLARERVTVALSADAGDEVLAGYNSYPLHAGYLKRVNKIPGALDNVTASLGKLFKPLGGFLSVNEAKTHQLNSVVEALGYKGLERAAILFQRMNELPESFVTSLLKKGVSGYHSPYKISVSGFANPTEVCMAIDYNNYLQNDILTKVDRATMSVSLEGREPLLDHRLLEFAARLPLSYKWDGHTQKKILKDIVHSYVPEKMMDRPKTGFTIPIYDWLRSDLSYLVEEYLSKESLSWSGLFHVPWVEKQVAAFRNNKLHYQPLIWKLLMFQMWYAKWMKNS